MTTAERRTSLTVALLLYLAFVAYQSLAGGAVKPCAAPLADDSGGWHISDVLANVVAYIPAGWLAGALAASFDRRALAVVAWLALSVFSLAMELAQSCLDGRVSSWIDWTTNTAGAALGVVAVPLIARGLRSARAGGRSRVVATSAPVMLAAGFVVGAWIAGSTAPWRFTLDIGTIRSNLAFLRSAPSFDPWHVAQHAFAWPVLAAALRALGGDRRRAARWLIVLLVGSLVAQVLLAWRALSWSELFGAAIGVAVSLVVLRISSAGGLARTLPWFAFAAIGAYELAPGKVAWATPRRFSWWPLIGRGDLVGALDFALLFCWFAFALVLSMRWRTALRPTAGATTRVPVVLPLFAVVALLAMEAAQQSIAGRVPDTSPALVAALAFVVAWVLTERVTARDRSRSHRRAAALPRRS